MKVLSEITRDDDIKNILSQYTTSKLLIQKIIGQINREFSKGPDITGVNTYAVTLLRNRLSITIRLELFTKNGTKLASRFEVSYNTLKDAN